MYTVTEICEILDMIDDAEERLKISTDKKEQLDLQQTIKELYMHLAEN